MVKEEVLKLVGVKYRQTNKGQLSTLNVIIIFGGMPLINVINQSMHLIFHFIITSGVADSRISWALVTCEQSINRSAPRLNEALDARPASLIRSHGICNVQVITKLQLKHTRKNKQTSTLRNIT
jgi:hypothetical protein